MYTNTIRSIMKKMKRDSNTTTKLYGYKIRKEAFTVKEDETNVINFIFEYYIQGIKYKPIIRMLKDEGIKPPNGI